MPSKVQLHKESVISNGFKDPQCLKPLSKRMKGDFTTERSGSPPESKGQTS